jgi:TRAP-type mannitol/chloroaromatic compound transport system substrate-binding protein
MQLPEVSHAGMHSLPGHHREEYMTTQSVDKKAVDRRKFLKGGAVAAGAAAATVAFPQVSRAQTTTLKMQSSWPATDVWQGMARDFADRVEKMSGGRLKVDLLAAGAVVPAFQIQDAVHKGVLDAGHHVAAYWYSKNRAASLFGTAPVFGADSAQTLAWIHYGGGKELYRELIEDILKLNIVGFFAFPMPTQPFGWFNKEVKTIDDVKGLKYRTVGLATEVMQGFGMVVQQLPAGEIAPAMEKGTIDAFEFNNPSSDRNFGAQNVAKRYYMGSYHQAMEFFEIIFNKTLFSRLPAELQAILEYGVEAANTANYGKAMDSYSKDLQLLIEKDGVIVERTPLEIQKAMLPAWDAVMEKYTSQDPFFKKVVDSQKAWSERIGFYTFLNNADYRMAYEHYFPGKLKT